LDCGGTVDATLKHAYTKAYDANIASFNAPRSRHFLALVRSNGVDNTVENSSLKADTVVVFDAADVPQSDMNAIRRCQLTQGSVLRIHYLVTVGTAEESINGYTLEYGAIATECERLGPFKTNESDWLDRTTELFRCIMWGSNETDSPVLDDAALNAANAAIERGMQPADIMDMFKLEAHPYKTESRLLKQHQATSQGAETNSQGAETTSQGAETTSQGAEPTSQGAETADSVVSAPDPTLLAVALPADDKEIVSPPPFDHEGVCFLCKAALGSDASGTLRCKECPLSFHVGCLIEKKLLTVPVDAVSSQPWYVCPHHQCQTCNASNTLLFRCEACVTVRCAKHMEYPEEITGSCDRLEDLGFHRPLTVCYMRCNRVCANYITNAMPVADVTNVAKHGSFAPTPFTVALTSNTLGAEKTEDSMRDKSDSGQHGGKRGGRSSSPRPSAGAFDGIEFVVAEAPSIASIIGGMPRFMTVEVNRRSVYVPVAEKMHDELTKFAVRASMVDPVYTVVGETDELDLMHTWAQQCKDGSTVRISVEERGNPIAADFETTTPTKNKRVRCSSDSSEDDDGVKRSKCGTGDDDGVKRSKNGTGDECSPARTGIKQQNPNDEERKEDEDSSSGEEESSSDSDDPVLTPIDIGD
jgi:hypothetical protein